MPIYFNDVAPFCPISRDQPVGPDAPWVWGTAPPIRTTIPHASNLASALIAVNIARSIISQMVFNRVRNNVHTPPPPKPRKPPKDPQDKVIDKRRHSRWKQGKPIKRKYKYYAKDENGEKDKDAWVITERIEQLSWSDPGWKTSMEFIYGDKGEGEPLDGGGARASGSDNDMSNKDPEPPFSPPPPEQPSEAAPPPDSVGEG